MILTNSAGLPEPIIRAIKNDTYSKGDADYSCTELIDPPRITLLKQRHADEIVEDAADRIWSLLGKLGHKLAQEAGEGLENSLVEQRHFITVLGRRISGQSDLAQWFLNDGTLTDYKFTSVWTRIFGDRIVEWTQQQNIYAELLHQHGYEVQRLHICAIYRDWSPTEARRKEEYPPRAEVIPLQLWPSDRRQEFIRQRVRYLVDCEPLPDDDLPECSARETWEKPTSYAVLKQGRKTALRVLGTREEALEWHKNNGGDYLETRPGRRPRCEDYCSVARFCSQYAHYQSGATLEPHTEKL